MQSKHTQKKPRRNVMPKDLIPRRAKFKSSRAAAELRAQALRQETKITGDVYMVDRSASGRVSGVVYGIGGRKGGASRDPAVGFAWKMRKALSAPLRPNCTVYDANGNIVAVIDGETRKRTDVAPSSNGQDS